MDDDSEFTAATGSTAAPPERERRRFARYGDSVSVLTLVDQAFRSAELQLIDAREALKDARRRVVQLEDALEGWRVLYDEVMRADGATPRAVAS
jgi:hypothetical protein